MSGTDAFGNRAPLLHQVPPEEIDKLLSDAAIPGILLAKAAIDDEGANGCFFGGWPTLPPETDWPVFDDPESGLSIPMHCLLQLDLSQLPRIDAVFELPSSGTIFLFYDPIVAPLADDGCMLPEGKGVAIIYCAQDLKDVPARTPPRMPDVSGLEIALHATSCDWSSPSSGDGDECRCPSFPEIPFRPLLINTFEAIGVKIPFELRALLEDAWAAQEESVAAQLGCSVEDLGFSLPEDSHTLLGASQKRTRPPFVKVPGLKSKDYRLLFSIAPDKDLEHDYLSGFGLGVWIPREDLAVLNFSRIVVWEEHYGQ